MDDTDLDLELEPDTDTGAPESRAPERAPSSAETLTRDIEEAVGSQLAKKGHPEPYAGLEGRPTTEHNGRYQDLAEFDQVARSNGTTLEAAVRDYREAEGILRKDPIAGAMHIWQRLGIDPRQAAAAMYDRTFGPNANYHAQVAAQQHQQSEVNSQVAAFARNPANEHFDKLRPLMAQLVQAGKATTLDAAYRLALKSNPTLEAKTMMKREFAKLDKDRKSVRRGRR